MQVIKPGKKKTPWSKELKCTGRGNGGGGCGAILFVEKADLFYTEEFEREGGGKRHTGFECPECDTITDISYDCDGLPHYGDWKKGKRCDT